MGPRASTPDLGGRDRVSETQKRADLRLVAGVRVDRSVYDEAVEQLIAEHDDASLGPPAGFLFAGPPSATGSGSAADTSPASHTASPPRHAGATRVGPDGSIVLPRLPLANSSAPNPPARGRRPMPMVLPIASSAWRERGDGRIDSAVIVPPALVASPLDPTRRTIARSPLGPARGTTRSDTGPRGSRPPTRDAGGVLSVGPPGPGGEHDGRSAAGSLVPSPASTRPPTAASTTVHGSPASGRRRLRLGEPRRVPVGEAAAASTTPAALEHSVEVASGPEALEMGHREGGGGGGKGHEGEEREGERGAAHAPQVTSLSGEDEGEESLNVSSAASATSSQFRVYGKRVPREHLRILRDLGLPDDEIRRLFPGARIPKDRVEPDVGKRHEEARRRRRQSRVGPATATAALAAVAPQPSLFQFSVGSASPDRPPARTEDPIGSSSSTAFPSRAYVGTAAGGARDRARARGDRGVGPLSASPSQRAAHHAAPSTAHPAAVVVDDDEAGSAVVPRSVHEHALANPRSSSSSATSVVPRALSDGSDLDLLAALECVDDRDRPEAASRSAEAELAADRTSLQEPEDHEASVVSGVAERDARKPSDSRGGARGDGTVGEPRFEGADGAHTRVGSASPGPVHGGIGASRGVSLSAAHPHPPLPSSSIAPRNARSLPSSARRDVVMDGSRRARGLQTAGLVSTVSSDASASSTTPTLLPHSWSSGSLPISRPATTVSAGLGGLTHTTPSSPLSTAPTGSRRARTWRAGLLHFPVVTRADIEALVRKERKRDQRERRRRARADDAAASTGGSPRREASTSSHGGRSVDVSESRATALHERGLDGGAGEPGHPERGTTTTLGLSTHASTPARHSARAHTSPRTPSAPSTPVSGSPRSHEGDLHDGTLGLGPHPWNLPTSLPPSVGAWTGIRHPWANSGLFRRAVRHPRYLLLGSSVPFIVRAILEAGHLQPLAATRTLTEGLVHPRAQTSAGVAPNATSGGESKATAGRRRGIGGRTVRRRKQGRVRAPVASTPVVEASLGPLGAALEPIRRALRGGSGKASATTSEGASSHAAASSGPAVSTGAAVTGTAARPPVVPLDSDDDEELGPVEPSNRRGWSAWSVLWTTAHLRPYIFQTLLPWQRVNQFPRATEVTRKDALARNVTRMKQLFGERAFAFLPRTFVLPHDTNEFLALCRRTPMRPWIVKPAGSSQGKGIRLLVFGADGRPLDRATLERYEAEQDRIEAMVNQASLTRGPGASGPRVPPLALSSGSFRGLETGAGTGVQGAPNPVRPPTSSFSAATTASMVLNPEMQASQERVARRRLQERIARELGSDALGPAPDSSGGGAGGGASLSMTTMLDDGTGGGGIGGGGGGAASGSGSGASSSDDGLLAGGTCIVSEYVDRPLLVDGYKFDLRVYAVVTSVVPLRIYVHEEGLARFATEPYSARASHLENRFVHLTNYSINKHSQKFVQPTEGHDGVGHKWTLRALNRRLQAGGGGTATHPLAGLRVDVGAMWRAIDDLIIKTIASAEGTIGSALELFASRESGGGGQGSGSSGDGRDGTGGDDGVGRGGAAGRGLKAERSHGGAGTTASPYSAPLGDGPSLDGSLFPRAVSRRTATRGDGSGKKRATRDRIQVADPAVQEMLDRVRSGEGGSKASLTASPERNRHGGRAGALGFAPDAPASPAFPTPPAPSSAVSDGSAAEAVDSGATAWNRRNHCFQLFGFDVLVDEHGRPWLLEVNFSPSLSVESPLDVAVKSRVVSDTLNLAAVPAATTADTAPGPRAAAATPASPDETHTLPLGVRRALVSDMSEAEFALVREAELEYEHRGGFRRVFPTGDARVFGEYARFLSHGRRANAVLAAYLAHAGEYIRTMQGAEASLARKRTDDEGLEGDRADATGGPLLPGPGSHMEARLARRRAQRTAAAAEADSSLAPLLRHVIDFHRERGEDAWVDGVPPEPFSTPQTVESLRKLQCQRWARQSRQGADGDEARIILPPLTEDELAMGRTGASSTHSLPELIAADGLDAPTEVAAAAAAEDLERWNALRRHLVHLNPDEALEEEDEEGDEEEGEEDGAYEGDEDAEYVGEVDGKSEAGEGRAGRGRGSPAGAAEEDIDVGAEEDDEDSERGGDGAGERVGDAGQASGRGQGDTESQGSLDEGVERDLDAQILQLEDELAAERS